MASLSAVFASIKLQRLEYNQPMWTGVYYSEPLEHWFLVRQEKPLRVSWVLTQWLLVSSSCQKQACQDRLTYQNMEGKSRKLYLHAPGCCENKITEKSSKKDLCATPAHILKTSTHKTFLIRFKYEQQSSLK